MARHRLLSCANALTALRLLAAPALFWAIASGRAGWATAIFCLGVVTDLGDGWVARRLGEATALGGLADHAVDAGFVALGCAALARTGVLPSMLAPLIAVAFLQYAVDSRWLGSGRLHGSPLGRWNGIAYFVIVAVPVVRDALGLSWPPPGLVMGLGWLLVASTLVSIADRLRRVARRRSRGSHA